MRLLISTHDYVRAGRSRPGIPLLLADDMTPLEPYHSFLLARLYGEDVPPGRRWGADLNSKTREAYGRILWDFARFLDANGLQWNRPFRAFADSVFAHYRDWSHGELGLHRSTVNWRLRLVAEFYEWALHTSPIDCLPFSHSVVTLSSVEQGSTQVAGGRVKRAKLDQALNEWSEEPAFLTGEQVRSARLGIRRTGQRLLFDLMARVGLRSCEARTFPTRYVFEPRGKSSRRHGGVVEVRLDPSDMEIKFSKPRVVHVPIDLMEDLHQYALAERNLARRQEGDPSALILTRDGQPYSKDSAARVFRYLTARVGTKVTPLMLRHSYAIHTLLYLRKHPDIPLDPLLYVRDRLGHRDVQTTMVYLRQIERLLGAEALAMMTEFDALYGVEAVFERFDRSSGSKPCFD